MVRMYTVSQNICLHLTLNILEHSIKATEILVYNTISCLNVSSTHQNPSTLIFLCSIEPSLDYRGCVCPGCEPSTCITEDVWLLDVSLGRWEPVHVNRTGQVLWHTSAVTAPGEVIFYGGIRNNLLDSSKPKVYFSAFCRVDGHYKDTFLTFVSYICVQYYHDLLWSMASNVLWIFLSTNFLLVWLGDVVWCFSCLSHKQEQK